MDTLDGMAGTMIAGRFNAVAFLEALYAQPTAAARNECVTPDDPPIGAAGDEWARRAAALLADVPDPERRGDLRELFEHRAAIAEYHGGLERTEAERLAFEALRAVSGAHGYPL